MSLQIGWLVVLGLMLGGYFVLAGYDYGTQMLYPLVGRDEPTKWLTRATLGPFFFGNEVWLVAFAGVLFGAFPFLEGELISGLYLLIVIILLGLVVGKAAVQLRGRIEGHQVRRLWDVLIVLGGLLPAAGWGLVVGLLLHGLPLQTDGAVALGMSDVFDPFVVLAGLSSVLLLAAHGATFLSMRSSGDVARRARHLTRPLLSAATLTVLITVFISGRAAVTEPAIALTLAGALILALQAGRIAANGQRWGLAFTATSVAVLLPVPLVGASQYPYALVSTVSESSGLTVARAAASHDTLVTLLPFGAVIVPVVLAYQMWSWWLFRDRVGYRTPSYF
ncbi:cytochrome d ubiquinol oxidase subunit II [Nocardia sp. SYP-A9097]|uniref:cytochrome d ubiquinol oxidase subunit II n=1 Tax=Nocardia sp. SYP-A9097 TaxID=2663237 RepID=UPI00129B4811|nr:cytochrome d ubiquinol oxidase subunit II [Nocardia sp. SYP-A9097]MRH90255.1 cytochrome d ubiquinol oxidase subunit II [Nocardia sp. SYP-A9097]